jgi:predicted Zn-dependent protease with MMP-like domain
MQAHLAKPSGITIVQETMSRRATQHLSPTLEDIERLAGEALATIPEELRRHVAEVVFQVEDFPDEETEREMGLETPFYLLGLYRGIALPHQNPSIVRRSTDMIFLYRRALLDYWCETGEPLFDIIRHVLVHEIGHHFGFSDADMHRIEAEGGD